MSDRDSFEAAIDANPREATNHLVYADWLDENGHESEAAFRRAMGEWHQSHNQRRAEAAAGRTADGDQGKWNRWLLSYPWAVEPGGVPSGVSESRLPRTTTEFNSTEPHVATRSAPISSDRRRRSRGWGNVWRTCRGMEEAFRRAFQAGKKASYGRYQNAYSRVLRYGKAPIDEIQTLVRDGGSINHPAPNNNHHFVLAGLLEDHDDPRAEIVKQHMADHAKAAATGDPSFAFKNQRVASAFGYPDYWSYVADNHFDHPPNDHYELSDGTLLYTYHHTNPKTNQKVHEVYWSPTSSYEGFTAVLTPEQLEEIKQEHSAVPI